MQVFEGTALEAFGEWSAARSLGEAWRIARASITTVLRLGAGASVVETRGPRPSEMLELYERESDPGSRRVREALSMLDLDVLSRPVPRGSTRHGRELAERIGAEARVPVLVDPAMGVSIEGADGIVDHLFAHYALARAPLRLRIARTSALASRVGGANGDRARPSREPARPLELWGYEASPATRIVRERLTELELPHVARQLAPHSPRRRVYFAREGTMEVPHLEDPSTCASRFGASDILAYLERRYALAPRLAAQDGRSRGAARERRAKEPAR